MRNEQKGYLELIFYSLLSGMVGVFFKLVHGMSVYSIVFFRAAIAAVFIFLVILFRKRLKELPLIFPLKTFMVGLFQGLSIFYTFMRY